ncbi:hypothetical protein NUH86_18030 [Sphingobium sp. JS3065]|nr:hypothetical protein [Sphingobium sp. JS3065]UZW57482.1 hypothetical protein NUH86_18030 [Sphingobium sp. JS3065]
MKLWPRRPVGMRAARVQGGVEHGRKYERLSTVGWTPGRMTEWDER